MKHGCMDCGKPVKDVGRCDECNERHAHEADLLHKK